MMGRILGVAAALFLAAAFTFSAPATAEAQASFGPQLNYGTEMEAMGVGARATLDVGTSGFGVIGSFDYFFPDDVDVWELNANLRYTFSGPYLGGGLDVRGISNGDSDTEVGLNFLGGVEFGGTGSLTPFLEGRFTTAPVATEEFIITGGVLF